MFVSGRICEHRLRKGGEERGRERERQREKDGELGRGRRQDLSQAKTTIDRQIDNRKIKKMMKSLLHRVVILKYVCNIDF